MPLITPFNDGNIPTELEDPISEVLTLAGLKKDLKHSDSIRDARNIFTSKGASIDKVAETVSNMMSRAETDAGRLKAAEMALKVHGILTEIDEKQVPEIIINITGSENKTLINLVLPAV